MKDGFWVDKDLWNAADKLNWATRKLAITLRGIAGASNLVIKTNAELATESRLDPRTVRKGLRLLSLWRGNGDQPFLTRDDRIHLRPLKNAFIAYSRKLWNSRLPEDIKDIWGFIEASWSRDGTKRVCKFGNREAKKCVPSIEQTCLVIARSKVRRIRRINLILELFKKAGVLIQVPTKRQIMAVKTNPAEMANWVELHNPSETVDETKFETDKAAEGNTHGHHCKIHADTIANTRGHHHEIHADTTNRKLPSNLPFRTSKTNRSAPASQEREADPYQEFRDIERQHSLGPSSLPDSILLVNIERQLGITIPEFKALVARMDLTSMKKRSIATLLSGKFLEAIQDRLNKRRREQARLEWQRRTEPPDLPEPQAPESTLPPITRVVHPDLIDDLVKALEL